MRTSDGSSDVCSSDLLRTKRGILDTTREVVDNTRSEGRGVVGNDLLDNREAVSVIHFTVELLPGHEVLRDKVILKNSSKGVKDQLCLIYRYSRSEEHTSELQSLMRISYAVFCLKQKKINNKTNITNQKTK